MEGEEGTPCMHMHMGCLHAPQAYYILSFNPPPPPFCLQLELKASGLVVPGAVNVFDHSAFIPACRTNILYYNPQFATPIDSSFCDVLTHASLTFPFRLQVELKASGQAMADMVRTVRDQAAARALE